VLEDARYEELTRGGGPLPRLVRPASARRFVEAVGERIALLGHEGGRFECWMWPLKLFHDLETELRHPGPQQPPLRETARTVEVGPFDATLVRCGQGFTLRQEHFACRDRRGLVVVHELSAPGPVEVELSFRCDFRPMWPAGLGGQIATRDRASGAFLLTEELGRFAALCWAPGASVEWIGADHALPRGTVRMRFRLEPGVPTPFLVAGAERVPAPLSEAARLGLGQAAVGLARAEAVVADARQVLEGLAAGWREERAELEGRWSAHLARTTALRSSDPAHDAAFLWSRIALERAWVAVDGLGRGLVAGLGPSRGGERPGYGWFFDGDALVAARALTSTGDREGAREVLRFAASHQREDGKLMHELSLSAGLCAWLEDYPYAYYKGINGAELVQALDHHHACTGDVELVRELWGTVEAALSWTHGCAGADGRVANRRAGIAAVEAGPLSDRIASEVFLQAAWIAALDGGARLARAIGREDSAARFEAWGREAREGFEAFWAPDRGRYGFALLHAEEGDGPDAPVDGRCDDLTAYLGLALARGVGAPERRLASARCLNRPALTSDWGARMFATDSSVYDPLHYNTGSVFPYLTSFTTLACYANGLLQAGAQVLDSQVRLVGFGGLGLLEEHLPGDRARVPPSGVPHQIFSSSAIVESTLSGLFGLAPDAGRGALGLEPALPPDRAFAALERLWVGDALLDVEVRRDRGERSTRHTIRLDLHAGGPLEVRLAPRFPALTRVVAARLDGAPVAAVAGALPSGARALEAVAARLAGALALEVDVEEGPSVVLPARPHVLDEPSRDARIEELSADERRVRWRFHGPAGTRVRLPLHGDREVRARGAALVPGRAGGAGGAGAELVLDFPAGDPEAFVELDVELELVP